jgi:two-component system, response regulator FlrC
LFHAGDAARFSAVGPVDAAGGGGRNVVSRFSVLLVEDDDGLREALADTLALDDLEVTAVADGPAAMAAIERESPSLVISDIQMKPWDGLELLRAIRREGHAAPVVLMTAFGSVPQAVDAIREGATDYLVKPVEASVLLERVRAFRQLPADDGELVAEDPRSRSLAEMARRVAEAEISVLLTGPSGSGKEAYARFIHRQSSRSEGPFVAINCAAIPEQMLEAELFGHEKGAFTGADRARAGRFELADGGTLLLDEIAELDVGLQAKLLRVLQERELQRLGGQGTIKLNVRVIAATNRDLPAEVREGRFREDLFYRLNVFPLSLPALAERPGDILPLARRALARHYRGDGPIPALSKAAMAALEGYPWPGNVRELDNVMQRALVLAGQRAEIGTSDLLFEQAGMLGEKFCTAPRDNDGSRLQQSVADREAEVIIDTLRSEGGHRGRAAERLGISPRTLRYKLSRLRKAGLNIPGDAGPEFAAERTSA